MKNIIHFSLILFFCSFIVPQSSLAAPPVIQKKTSPLTGKKRLIRNFTKLPNGIIFQFAPASLAYKEAHILFPNLPSATSTSSKPKKVIIPRNTLFYALRVLVHIPTRSHSFSGLLPKSFTFKETICDELLSYNLFPKIKQIAKRYKKVVLALYKANNKFMTQCHYTLAGNNAFIDAKDPSRNIRKPEFFTYRFTGLKPFRGAILSSTRRSEVAKPVVGFFVQLPIDVNKPQLLTSYLKTIALHMYKTKRYKNKIINFIAVQKKTTNHDVNETIWNYMAFQTKDGDILFVSRILLAALTTKNSLTGKAKTNLAVQIYSLNLPLTQKLSTLKPGSPSGQLMPLLRHYIRKDVERDARKVLETVGLFAAKRYNIKRLSIVSIALLPHLPAKTVMLQAHFQKTGQQWQLIKQSKQKRK